MSSSTSSSSESSCLPAQLGPQERPSAQAHLEVSPLHPGPTASPAPALPQALAPAVTPAQAPCVPLDLMTPGAGPVLGVAQFDLPSDLLPPTQFPGQPPVVLAKGFDPAPSCSNQGGLERVSPRSASLPHGSSSKGPATDTTTTENHPSAQVCAPLPPTPGLTPAAKRRVLSTENEGLAALPLQGVCAGPLTPQEVFLKGKRFRKELESTPAHPRDGPLADAQPQPQPQPQPDAQPVERQLQLPPRTPQVGATQGGVHEPWSSLAPGVPPLERPALSVIPEPERGR
jgi:hypothetical protein